MTEGLLRELLLDRLETCHLAASPAIVDRLSRYLDLLRAWNRTVNVVGFDLENPSTEALDRIIIEPVGAARVLAMPSQQEIADIGSGGGTPGIPVAVACDARHLTMVESRTKKATFLREALRALSIPGEVVTERLEGLGTSHAIGPVDLVTVRAIRVNLEMFEILRGFVKPTGRLAFFQSRESVAGLLRDLEPIAGPATVSDLPGSSNPVLAVFHARPGWGVPRETMCA